MLKLLIPTALAALLYKYGNTVSDAAGRLGYSLKGIHFEGFKGLLTPKIIHVKMELRNPTRTELFFDRIDLTGRWNDNTVGDVVLEKRTMIPANGTADVTLPFRLSGVTLLTAIWNAFKAKQFGKFTATGFITAGVIKVPVEIEQDLSKIGQ